MTPEQRRMRSRLGAHAKWARTDDRTAATEPARQGFRAKLARQIDPDGVMDPGDLERRVDSAVQEHCQRMALKSSRARRKRREVA